LNDEPTGDAYKMMLGKFADSWIASRATGDGFSFLLTSQSNASITSFIVRMLSK
jgi:hypothetical protein